MRRCSRLRWHDVHSLNSLCKVQRIIVLSKWDCGCVLHVTVCDCDTKRQKHAICVWIDNSAKYILADIVCFLWQDRDGAFPSNLMAIFANEAVTTSLCILTFTVTISTASLPFGTRWPRTKCLSTPSLTLRSPLVGIE